MERISVAANQIYKHAFLLGTKAVRQCHAPAAPSPFYGLSGNSPVGTIMFQAAPPRHPALISW